MRVLNNRKYHLPAMRVGLLGNGFSSPSQAFRWLQPNIYLTATAWDILSVNWWTAQIMTSRYYKCFLLKPLHFVVICRGAIDNENALIQINQTQGASLPTSLNLRVSLSLIVWAWLDEQRSLFPPALTWYSYLLYSPTKKKFWFYLKQNIFPSKTYLRT